MFESMSNLVGRHGSVGQSLRRAASGVALASVLGAGSVLSTPGTAAAATGVGVGYAPEVICDMYMNTIQVRARAQAAPNLNVQAIQVRFHVYKSVNGTWVSQGMDGNYATTGWYQFTHYRNYNGIYSPTANPDWITLPMAGSDGIFQVSSQYRWFYNGWTAPGPWLTTQSYMVLPYRSQSYPACFL
jgi:hypothetical protein